MAKIKIQKTVDVEVTACDVTGCSQHMSPKKEDKATWLLWTSIKTGGGGVVASFCPEHTQVLESGNFVLSLSAVPKPE